MKTEITYWLKRVIFLVLIVVQVGIVYSASEVLAGTEITSVESVKGQEFVKAWGKVFKEGNAVSVILKNNTTVLEYIVKNPDLIPQSAIDKMIGSINYPIKEIISTDGVRGLTILLERGGIKTNKAIVLHPSNSGYNTISVLIFRIKSI